MDVATAVPSSPMPTGDVTFVLTDIEGSTKRWEKFPKLMPEVVRRHDEILIGCIEQFGGQDLRKKGEGDSHFAVFGLASSAVRAALEIQRSLASEEWGAVGPVKVRIAIHTGEAEFRDNDYFGQNVNRCARLRGVGHGGQTILSEATRRLVAGQLPADCTLRDLGSHRLKDLLEPERIFQLEAPGLDSEFAPLASLSAAKHNLPVQLTSFVGRAQQLDQVKRLLFNKHLVTLLGAGGTGKTRLALQIAADLIEEFPDGVWFAPLAALQDPNLVAQAVAECLPISIRGKDPLAAIVDNYEEARALIIVDNCEHLDRAPGEFVNQLLSRCPSLTVLATSREPLSVRGESCLQVPPLDCNLGGALPDVDSVARLEAVQLFRDRARSRRSDEDILSEETAEDIAALCKRLDGIPLALEQAAANLSFMSPGEILGRLDRHFAMLALDEVGVEDRHKTIQATIDWSYSRLTDPEKQLFARLSVFAGGWSMGAAEHVCANDAIPADRVGMVLEQLVKRSLLVSEMPEGLKVSRYRMLEPIREYAVSRRNPAEAEELSERLFDWLFHVSHQAYEAGLDADGGRYAKILTLEHDNIRTALQWAVQSERFGSQPLEMSIFLYRFWLTKGHVREGLSWFQKAMNASGTPREALLAQALLYMGILSWQQGALESAEKALTRSFELYEGLHDQAGVAKARANLGNVAFARDHFAAAEVEYQQTANIFRLLGDTEFLATALENLGVAQSKQQRLEEACVSLEEAVGLRRRMGAKGAVAKALDSLLGVYSMQGRLREHLHLFAEACDLAVETDDGFALENLLELAVQVAINAGDYGLAARASGALELAVEQNERLVPPTVAAFREQLYLQVLKELGPQAYKKWAREGRSAGVKETIQFICSCLHQPPCSDSSL